MIRLIKLAFLAVVAAILITLAMGNRQLVTLYAWPSGMNDVAGMGAPSITLPLFAIIIGAIIIGVALGFIWEWLREWRHRSAAESRRREAARLKREVDRMKAERNKGKDEVLAMLDEAS